MEMSEELLALLTPEEREAWEISQKATPGPWRMKEPRETEECTTDHDWCHHPCNDIESATSVEAFTLSGGGTYPSPVISSWGHDADGVEAKLADVKFITTAREGYPAALVALAELRRKVQQVERERDASHLAASTECARANQLEAKVQATETHYRMAQEAMRAEAKRHSETLGKLEAAEARNAEMERDGWVSVEERLPENGARVIIAHINGISGVWFAEFRDNSWWHCHMPYARS